MLAASHGLVEIHPGLGLLGGDAKVQTPWLRGFEVLDVLPWREGKVRQTLRAMDAGIVEVKTRGRAVDPDHTQQSLRGRGHRPLTVFVLRLGKVVKAVVTCRS
jgi:hypothetical protein